MSGPRRLVLTFVFLAFFWPAGGAAGQQGRRHSDGPGKEQKQHAHKATHSMGMGAGMSPRDQHLMHLHMKLTAPRPKTSADVKRDEEIVKTLREVLGRYTNYRAAERDGYLPFGPSIVGREFHFTNWRHGFLAKFWLDPARPTSLLYKVTPDGYELTGAMYTAPRTFSEDQLHERVPLSLARWHAHVNFCLPPRGQFRAGNFRKWLAISTEQECKAAGGRFFPRLLGWMVHVYPFEPALNGSGSSTEFPQR